MPGIASRNRREQKRRTKQAGQHRRGSGLPKSLELPFLRLVKEELGRVPCKEGHAWCRGTYRDQEHFDAWQTAFDNLWSAMEQMPGLPDTLRTPLSKVVEIRRDVPRTKDLQSSEWEEWFDRDEAAAWGLFVALAELDGRCKDCQRKAITELEL